MRITSLKLYSHCSHTHTCTRQQGCCPWQPFFLSWSLYCTHNLSAQFAMLSWCLFIGKNGATNSSSSSTKVAANSSTSWIMVATNLWHLGWVHMVGATPAAGSWQWQPSPRVGLLPYKWQYPNNRHKWTKQKTTRNNNSNMLSNCKWQKSNDKRTKFWKQRNKAWILFIRYLWMVTLVQSFGNFIPSYNHTEITQSCLHVVIYKLQTRVVTVSDINHPMLLSAAARPS